MLTREKETFMNDTIYDHYIAMDWAFENMAIARMTKKSNKITAIDVPSDIADLRAYLNAEKHAPFSKRTPLLSARDSLFHTKTFILR